MSTETVTPLLDSDVIVTTEVAPSSTWYNSSELTTVTSIIDEVSTPGSFQNATNHAFDMNTPITLYEVFIITEIIMIALELTISTAAAIKLPRWRRNYRNQMLMQLSAARFFKRVIFLFTFLQQAQYVTPTENLDTVLDSLQLYIDFVIVVLVFLFIRHMYNSLIIVVVKISRNNLIKVLMWSWCLPVPICAVWTAATLSGLLDRWLVYLLVCCIFRWPLMFIGSAVYIAIVYRVLTDKIRKFARSLTVVTFLLCFIINFYLLSTDIVKLWCQKSSLILISYVSGFLTNLLVLSIYIILILLSISHKRQRTTSIADYSIADHSIAIYVK